MPLAESPAPRFSRAQASLDCDLQPHDERRAGAVHDDAAGPTLRRVGGLGDGHPRGVPQRTLGAEHHQESGDPAGVSRVGRREHAAVEHDSPSCCT